MKKPSRERVYLTPVEVSEMLMVSTTSVRLWASKGLLKAKTTVGGHRRFLLKDIEAFARERGIELQVSPSTDMRLLIVDDDPQLRLYLSELLEDMPGIEALEVAADGFDAGQKVQAFKPDVLLLDLMMPGINGLEVCQRIKKADDTAGIRVIAMTGYGSAENVSKILNAGAEVCLNKPLNKQELLQALGISSHPRGKRIAG